MGILLNQNSTDISSDLQMAPWESPSSQTATNTMIVLGVLTFVLQLCLALYFMLRCWRLDKKVQKVSKHSDIAEELCKDPVQVSAYVCHQPDYRLCKDECDASEEYEPSKSPIGLHIHWDLVQ
ncbi:uncharacterized protein ACB058_000241 [Synchiropus picturatus]